MIYKLRLSGLFCGFMLLSLSPSLYSCAPGNEGAVSDEQFFGFSNKKRDSYVLDFSKATEISVVGASPVAPAATVSCTVAEGDELKVGAISQLNASMTGLKGIIDFKAKSSGIFDFGQNRNKGESSGSSDIQQRDKAEPCSKDLLTQLVAKSRDGLLQVPTTTYLIAEEDPNSPSERSLPDGLEGEDGAQENVCGLSFPMQKGTWTTVRGGVFGAPRSYPGGHSGHDFAPLGGKHASIFAVAAGVTFDVGWNYSYGNRIKIRHSDCDQRFAFVTHYAHNSTNVMAANRLRVLGRQLIAKAGDTGSASRGVHLHFDLINVANGGFQYVNPLTYMTKGYPE
jgi:murein DD-endopeptidase MepM/ murein hydrolase activator NlpD